MKKVRFRGLDVHAETIAVAVAESDGEVRSLGSIPNREESIGKLVNKLGSPEQLRACYEAGPTGYVLYWQLTELGVKCEVVAPTLVPVKAGDRVKTDRRDARKLARNHRAGELMPVWVPDEAHEALRDLVRAREAACLFFLIAGGHIFRNGNKRTAVLALDQFLTANSWYLFMSNAAVKRLAEDTAEYRKTFGDHKTAMTEIAKKLKENSFPFRMARLANPKVYRALHKFKRAIRQDVLNHPDAQPRQISN